MVLTAVGMLVLTWGVVVGPQVAARFKPDWLLWLADTGWIALLARYAIVIAAIGIQLIAYHLWLAAGQRRLGDVWPGVRAVDRAVGGGGAAVRLLAHASPTTRASMPA